MDTRPENPYEKVPWNEPICQNCNRFFHHNDDEDSRSICSLDKDFEPYWDNEELMDRMDFSCCRALSWKRVSMACGRLAKPSRRQQ